FLISFIANSMRFEGRRRSSNVEVHVRAGRPVTPEADSVVGDGDPGSVVDLDAAVAALELEAGRRLRVEAEHAVVRVTTEGAGDAHASVEAAVVDASEVVERARLHHEVIDALGEPLPERHRVMPRVHVEEGHVDLEAPAELALDAVGEAKAEHLFEERPARLEILRAERDVSEALLAGDESVLAARGVEWRGRDREPRDDLEVEPRRLAEADERRGDAVRALLGRADGHVDPR